MTANNHKHNTETDALIELYLRGHLTGSELAGVELRMLEDPVFFAAVEEAERVQQAFRQHVKNNADVENGQEGESTQDENLSDPRGRIESKVPRLSFPQWIRQPISMAASVLLIIAIGFSSVEMMQGPGVISSSQNQIASGGYAINSVVTIASRRSTAQQIELPAGRHLLQLDVGIALDDPVYAVTLTGEETDEQHTFRLTPDSNGMLRLLTSEAWQGEYAMTVVRNTADGETNSNDALMMYRLNFSVVN